MTTNRMLLAIAAIAGTLPLLVGPGPLAVETIGVVQLAEAIAARDTSLLLLDVRTGSADSAERIPTSLPASDSVWRSLNGSDRLVVLYGNTESELHSAVDRARGAGVSSVVLLEGSLEAWYREVIYPVLPAEADPRQQERFEHVARLSRHFGGLPRRMSRSDSTAVTGEGFRRTCGF